MGKISHKYRKNQKKPFLTAYQAEDATLELTFNGLKVPINLEQVTVDWGQENPDQIERLNFELSGELDHHLNIGELGRQYEDDPIVQELLSYVVRAELLYVLEKSWLEQRKKEQPSIRELADKHGIGGSKAKGRRNTKKGR